jgi:DNA polymerase-1
MASDWGQLEIRILTHQSGDKRLIEIFNSGEDIHSMVGHDLTGQPLEKIKKDRPTRTRIKAVHFSLVYGKKPRGIYSAIVADLAAEGLDAKDVTLEEIEETYEAYFKKYKGVARLIQDLIDYADENNAAINMFGFRREINKEGDWRKTQWQNASVNSPIQSAAHFLSVIAMALMKLKPERYKYFRKLLMEIHDAFYSRMKVKHLPEGYAQGKELMEHDVPEHVKKWFGFKLKVPLVSDAKAGFRLGTMVEYKGEPPDVFIDMWREKFKVVEEDIKKSVAKFSR